MPLGPEEFTVFSFETGPQQAAGFCPQVRLGIRYGANGSGRISIIMCAFRVTLDPQYNP